MEKWLTTVGNFEVEKREIKRTGNAPYVPVETSGIGVLHTTEGSTIEGAYKELVKSRSAPHFIIGEGKIFQTRPLGVRGAALHQDHGDSPNKFAEIQIEMVGKSRQQLWMPEEGTLNPTLRIMAYAAKEMDIPLSVPVDTWADDGSDIHTIWASENTRRKAAANGLWPAKKGWWMHMEVPWQGPSWHWDCGAMRRRDMLAAAGQLLLTDEFGHQPDAPAEMSPIKVLVNGNPVQISALFDGARTWIAARPAITVFGGEITGVDDDPFRIHLKLGAKAAVLNAKNIKGTGFVPFGDFNKMYMLPFEFNGGKHQLEISNT